LQKIILKQHRPERKTARRLKSSKGTFLFRDNQACRDGTSIQACSATRQ